jgi:integrative and conjugative element protein (TIGR02256 family)
MIDGRSVSEGELVERMVAAVQAGDTDRLLDIQDQAGVGVYIARETFEAEYNGRTETIKAGERVRSGHELLRGRTHLFERAADLRSIGMMVARESVATAATRAHLADSSARPPTSTDVDRTPAQLRLRAGAATATIRLDGAWQRIREESRDSRDGRETAGWLFASRYGSPLEIVAATGPGERAVREQNRCVIDREWSNAFARELAANDSDLIHVGQWHVHPSGTEEPSEADLRSWQVGYETLEERAGFRSVWSAVIVTPGHFPVDGDIDPQFHGFIVRRDPINRALGCELAAVLEV